MAGIDEQAIPILRVTEHERAVAWYARMGFVEEWAHRFEPDFPAFVSIVRDGVRIFPSEHEGDAPGPSLLYLRLADVEAIAAAYDARPVGQPWRALEVELVDPDGNRIRVGRPTA